MVDKASLSIGIIALLVAAGGIAYSQSLIGGVTNEITKAKNELSTQLTSKTSPIDTSVNTIRQDQSALKQEQAAIRTLVEQKVGGLEQALAQAQARLAEAEKIAAAQAKELEQLRASAALEEKAKLEKAPVIYGVMDAPDFVNLVWPRFREAYPWAPEKPSYVEGFAPLIARFVSESQAGAPTADIIYQSEPQMLIQLLPGGFLQPFPEMRYRGLYPANFADEQGASYVVTVIPMVIAYNINLVPADQAPKGWLELADPKWNGKIVMQDPRLTQTSTQVLVSFFPVLGEQRWDAFMKGLAANKPVFTNSNTEAFTKVVAGEFPITLALVNDFLPPRFTPGTPVAIAFPQEDPKAIAVGAITRMAVTAKGSNPNFAKLFLEWFASPLGQRALAESGRPPALQTVDAPASLGKLLPAGTTIIPAYVEYYTKGAEWTTRIKSYFP